MAEQNVRWPQDATQLAKADIKPETPLMAADSADEEKLAFITHEQLAESVAEIVEIKGIEVKPVAGGATEATAVILPAGPAGENRKMTGVTGWFKNATGPAWEAPVNYNNTNWWDGTTWSLGSSVELPNTTVNEIGEAVDKSVSQDISTQSIKSTSLPIKGTFASSADANLSIGESCYNYNTKQIITKVSAAKNIGYTPNLNVEYQHYDGRFFRWNGTDLVEIQKVLSGLGSDDKRPISQEVSTQVIKSIPITFKGIYASTTEANIVDGESYYNHSIKEIVSRISSTKVITYKPNLNVEYSHYDGRVFKWNGTDLVEVKKVLASLGADEKKPINQNVSSYGFKATSLILKGAYASTTDANLAVGESCYNYNTKQIVSRVNTDRGTTFTRV